MNKIMSIILLVMLLFTSIALLVTKESTSALPPDSSTGKAQIGGNFTLVGTDEKPVSDATFRGRYMLVFFGFTRCPDVCPTTLATITSAMEMLGDKAALVTPIFISVDVKNDTPARMKEYLTNFDSRVVGLSGSEEQLKQVAGEYKAYYSEKPAAAAGEENLMDHSSFLYLMDKQGEYITHFPYSIAPDALAKALAESMK